jgi:hypothetical protein
MLTGEIRNQIDRIWNSFWAGGIANPLEVIEQITYLLFLKRLDELETAEELKATGKRSRCKSGSFPKAKTTASAPTRTSVGTASRTPIRATCTSSSVNTCSLGCALWAVTTQPTQIIWRAHASGIPSLSRGTFGRQSHWSDPVTIAGTDDFHQNQSRIYHVFITATPN